MLASEPRVICPFSTRARAKLTSVAALPTPGIHAAPHSSIRLRSSISCAARSGPGRCRTSGANLLALAPSPRFTTRIAPLPPRPPPAAAPLPGSLNSRSTTPTRSFTVNAMSTNTTACSARIDFRTSSCRASAWCSVIALAAAARPPTASSTGSSPSSATKRYGSHVGELGLGASVKVTKRAVAKPECRSSSSRVESDGK
mmetsp:Transcript_25727/g.84683  ORF Transcript_25727/g.84683 Transcript_25727/m.84683 type:complete len:200 (-) Transcript_25727:611-1210(-)